MPKDGLILKIMSVGLCGSDIRNLTTDSRKGNYPFIYGHEIVGFVDEIGAEQTKYQVGDRLFLFPGTYCMECEECISGHSENCSDTKIAKLAGTGEAIIIVLHPWVCHRMQKTCRRQVFCILLF